MNKLRIACTAYWCCSLLLLAKVTKQATERGEPRQFELQDILENNGDQRITFLKDSVVLSSSQPGDWEVIEFPQTALLACGFSPSVCKSTILAAPPSSRKATITFPNPGRYELTFTPTSRNSPTSNITLFATLPAAPKDVQRLVQFGDSLSDDGTGLKGLLGEFFVFPEVYRGNRLTNGKTWLEVVDKDLEGVVRLGFATGNADAGEPIEICKEDYPEFAALLPDDLGCLYIPNLQNQIKAYLGSVPEYMVPENDVPIILIGGNDLQALQFGVDPFELAGIIVGAYSKAVDTLIARGSKLIILCTLLPGDRFPVATSLDDAVLIEGVKFIIGYINEQIVALAEGKDLESNGEYKVRAIPTDQLFLKALKKLPGNFNKVDACGQASFPQVVGVDESCTRDRVKKFAFIDELHPTAKLHKLWALEVAPVLQEILQEE